MKKKTTLIKHAVVKLCIIVLIALIGCGESAETPEKGSSTYVSWSDKGYQSAEEMISESDAAIIGEVTDSYTEVRNNFVFTRQVVKVITVYKGELKEGDSMEVLQTGGTDGGIETAPLAEVPFMEHGNEYAVCLHLSPPSEKYGQYYLISGGYQGIAEITPSGKEKDTAIEDYFTDIFKSSLSAEIPTPTTHPAYTAASGGVSANSEISYELNEHGQTYGNMNPELSPEIQEAPQLIAAIGIDGTSGYVYYDDLQGELPHNPEEALAYMERLNEQIAEARKRGDQYLRYIPLYESDGKTVIGSFGISIPTQIDIVENQKSND